MWVVRAATADGAKGTDRRPKGTKDTQPQTASKPIECLPLFGARRTSVILLPEIVGLMSCPTARAAYSILHILVAPGLRAIINI